MTRYSPWVLIAAVAGSTTPGVALGAQEAAEPRAAPVVGFWESMETSQGGIGSALELRADGHLRWTVVVLVEAGYVLEEGKLFMLDESGGRQELPVTFGSGEMEMTGPDGSALTKTRFRGPAEGSSPIVGDWFYGYFGQGQAFERYTEDGRMLFRLPMRTDAGTYRLDGDRLRVEVQEKAGTWHWRLEGEDLVTGPPGEERRFRRVPAGAWYLPPPD